MPAYTWIEDQSSRSASIVRKGRKATSTYKKSWKIFGSSDDLAIHSDVEDELWRNNLYWQYPGQPQNQLHLDHYTLEYLGDQAWQLEATYVKEGAEDPGGDSGGGGDGSGNGFRRSRSFDTSGQTAHRTQALADTSVGPFDTGEFAYPGPGAPSMNGAIGVDGSSVNGIDYVVPSLQWNETYDIAAGYVTTPYIRMVSKLTGTVNNAPFRTFAAGEVLFLGCSGAHEWDAEKGDGPWSLTYKFLASPNAGPGLTLPAIKVGSITGITKLGHEYLWVRYEDNVSDTSLVKVPRHVYVNRIYRQDDFSQLGIGTGVNA
jgi:hypothetical protein